ncbi:GntR family transcriptional regulator [Horticoccus sp. 23ND18S-11]|uniref:GntR family transcriptional regulator n=1 Tax=Horticoccus sp. 23ND18S-11 TaxID=3391832 RepID=UPI0039C985B1
MALHAIRSVSIRHSVADAVRSALREGHLKPGENISEVALAHQFEVSRGPIREALLVLVEEGLLTHSPNRGFSVIDLSAEDKEHIAELRLMLESRALERGRERVTPADLKRLGEMKEELVSLFKDSERPARDAMEIAFHGYVWELSGNPWLVNALKRTMMPLFLFGRYLGISRASMDVALADQQHQLYIDYLAGKTNRTAEQCVRFHLGLPL